MQTAMMVACKGTEDHIRSTASLDAYASGYIHRCSI